MEAAEAVKQQMAEQVLERQVVEGASGRSFPDMKLHAMDSMSNAS